MFKLCIQNNSFKFYVKCYLHILKYVGLSKQYFVPCAARMIL